MQIGLAVFRQADTAEPGAMRLVACNPAASVAAGVDLTSKVGLTLDEAFPGLTETELPGILVNVLESGEPLDLGKVDYPALGADRVIHMRLFPLSNGSLGISLEDVTEAAKAEQVLRAYAMRLESSNRELESFAAVAAHDLQEPLRKIMTFAERLRERLRGRLGDTEADYFDRMMRATERMQRLITDLLHLSRVGMSNETLGRIDLGRVLHDVQSDLEPRIAAVGARVDVSALPAIRADATQIHQLFLNLIGNALKFHRQGVPPVVSVRGELLENETAHGPRVRIEVADNGLGFDERFSERIFEPFQRLHGRHAYEGTGMGLAICRRIVERHGGTIQAHSRIGKGTTMVVILPVGHTEESHP